MQPQSGKGTVCTIIVRDDRVGWMRGLVNGLQNRLHPFESGTDLKMMKETRVFIPSPSIFFRRVWCAFSWLMMPTAIYDDIVNSLRGYPQRPARISSTTCEDIVNDLRGYRRFSPRQCMCVGNVADVLLYVRSQCFIVPMCQNWMSMSDVSSPSACA